MKNVLKGKSKILEALQPASDATLDRLEADAALDPTVQILDPLHEMREEIVLETQDCKCDHSTRASGFCIHGNNI